MFVFDLNLLSVAVQVARAACAECHNSRVSFHWFEVFSVCTRWYSCVNLEVKCFGVSNYVVYETQVRVLLGLWYVFEWFVISYWFWCCGAERHVRERSSFMYQRNLHTKKGHGVRGASSLPLARQIADLAEMQLSWCHFGALSRIVARKRSDVAFLLVCHATSGDVASEQSANLGGESTGGPCWTLVARRIPGFANPPGGLVVYECDFVTPLLLLLYGTILTPTTALGTALRSYCYSAPRAASYSRRTENIKVA